MTFPRVNGLRSFAFDQPGEIRTWLNGLVLEGRKKGTAGRLSEYAAEGEELEYVGERLAVLDNDDNFVTTVVVTGLEIHRFIDVPWLFGASEGEGDETIEDWRDEHRKAFARAGTTVDDDTLIACLNFELESAK